MEPPCPPQDPSDSRKVYKGSCLACRAAKARCNRVVPCERCIKYCLECHPVDKGRGRPPRQKKEQEGSRGKAAVISKGCGKGKVACKKLKAKPVKHIKAKPVSSHGGSNNRPPPAAPPPRPCCEEKDCLHELMEEVDEPYEGLGEFMDDDDDGDMDFFPKATDDDDDDDDGGGEDKASNTTQDYVSETSSDITADSAPPSMDQGGDHDDMLSNSNQVKSSRDFLTNPFVPEMYYRSACLLMLAEFGRVLRSNQLDQRKVFWSMKSQAMRLVRFGGDDYSRMFLDMQASLMGLQDWRHVMSPEEKAYVENIHDPATAEAVELQRTKGAEDMRMIMDPLKDASSAYSYSVNIFGEPITYCSDRYRELFLDDAELEGFNQQRLFAPLLWGKTVSPDDHAAFFAAVIQASCCVGADVSDCSLVVKCLKKDGQRFLALVRFRSFYGNSGMGYGFSIMELPNNHHTTSTSTLPVKEPVEVVDTTVQVLDDALYDPFSHLDDMPFTKKPSPKAPATLKDESKSSPSSTTQHQHYYGCF